MITNKTFSRKLLPLCLIVVLTPFVLLNGCGQSEPGSSDKQSRPVSVCDKDNAGLILPKGFCAQVIADNLGVIRHLAVRDNGDIYVSMRHQRLNIGGIIAMRDANGDGRMDVFERLSEEPGMGIRIDGDYLIFASDERIYRFLLAPDALKPVAEPEILVDGFPSQDRHSGKPFAIDNDGNLYVNVGSQSNACQLQDRVVGEPGQQPCQELESHAGIWKFRKDRPGQDFYRDGVHFAKGIRNAYAIDWHPTLNNLYVTQHGRDQLHELWPGLYTDETGSQLPAEEMILVQPGEEYGWPYCYYDQIQQTRVLAPEYGGDGKSTNGCEQYPPPIIAFPGHYGPNDLVFYNHEMFPPAYRGGAFIAFHGSYNRGPFGQVGYQVVFVPFDQEGNVDQWQVFADNFAGKTELTTPQDADYRPTGLAVGSDGALFITDSVQGRIWKISYIGASAE